MIVKQKADYLFSLKGNQDSLHEDVKEYFSGLNFDLPLSQIDKNILFQSTSTHDTGHGRVEDRDCAVSGDVDWLRKLHPKWGTINSIGMIESTRTTKDKTTGKDKTTTERRYCRLTGASNPVSGAIRHETRPSLCKQAISFFFPIPHSLIPLTEARRELCYSVFSAPP
jgi:hypothetical protein